MKKRFFSLMAGTAVLFAVACNSAEDETMDNDTTTTADAVTETSGSVSTSDVKTTSDGRSYVLRTRKGSASSDGSSATGTSSATVEYDTVWVNLGTENRYYTLDGPDTLYFDTDQFNTWWSSPETDNELKMRANGTKVKVDEDGSYKIKSDTTKIKVDESGKTKVKKRDD